MLYEAPPFYMIDGVSVLRDHVDPLQYYFQPLGPRFVTRKDGALDVPQVLLIKYRSATRSGGFLDFDVHLGLTDGELASVRREIQRLANLPRLPNLSPVPVVDGSVKLMLLGAQSGAAPAEGGPNFVRSIQYPAKPALYNNNPAAFSVELDERGVTILDQAMRGEMAPIGVVYSLDYLALRPAYHVSLHIDWDRMQDFLDETYGHEGLFTAIQIQDTVEKLQDKRIIQFEADTFVPEDDEAGGTVTGRRDAAVARVRDMITDAFFEPSIDPLRQAPDGWDKARDLIKSFSPQRSAPLGVFSYKKTHYQRIDQKRLDVDFSERITMKRSMHPQGHLSGLFRVFGQGLDPKRLVISVNADDPWFRRRKVRVIARADFQNDPVRSLSATLRYGGETRSALLDKDKAEAEVEWPSTVREGRMVEPVSLEYVAELKPVEGGERPNRLVSGPIEVLGDTAELQPRDLFSLETIPVVTLPSFPFDRYPRVEVQLRYEDPARAIRQDDLVVLTKENPNGAWQRFLVGPPAGPVMAKITYRAADLRDRDMPFAPLTRPQVDVPDPFPQRLRLSVVPLLNFNEVDRAFVDLVYEDPANRLRVEDSIELAQGLPARPFMVDRVDPMLDRVRFKVTILMKDSNLLEGPWSTTLAKRIIVRTDLKGHRAVTLRAPPDFARARLERIEVEARARDEIAGLAFADRFDFAAPGASAVFEFDFVDPANDSFELRIRRLFANGMSAAADWRRFDQDDVTIAAG
jgi:hypothetical protein